MSFVKLAVLILPGLYNCAMEPESQALTDDDECTATDCMISALQVRGKRLESYSMCGGNIAAVNGYCCANSASTFQAPRFSNAECFCPGDVCILAGDLGAHPGDWGSHPAQRYVGRNSVADEGAGVGQCHGGDRWGKGCTDLEGCKQLCDENPRCSSFSFGVGGVQRGKCYLKSKHVTASDQPSYKPGHGDWRTYYKVPRDGGFDDQASQPFYGGNSLPDPQQTGSDAIDRAAAAEARAKAAEARAAEAEAQSRIREAENRAAAAEARAKAAEASAKAATSTQPPQAQSGGGTTTAPASQSSPGPSPAAPDLSKMFDPKTWSDPEALKKMMDPNLWKGMMGR